MVRGESQEEELILGVGITVLCTTCIDLSIHSEAVMGN